MIASDSLNPETKHRNAKSYGKSQVYSRQLTGVVPNIQVVQGLSASRGLSHSPNEHTINKRASKHANRSLSRSYLPIFADGAITAIDSYAEMSSVSRSIANRDGIIFDFYPGLPHIYIVAMLNHLWGSLMIRLTAINS